MPKRNLIWIVTILAAAAVVIWVTRSDQPLPSQPARDDLAGLRDAYALIQERYYGPMDDESLNCGAIRGMVAQLDEYSTYVPPEDVEAFQARLRGVQYGLGLVVAPVDGGFRVVGPLLNSPAHHAGLQAGDELLAINGESTADWTLEQVRQRLDGTAGQVTLAVQRGEGWRKEFVLSPGEFELETVVGLFRDDNGRWVYRIGPAGEWAYVRIREFVPDTGSKLREVLRRPGATGGLVLDLRGNPGGTLPAAVEVANEFLRDGAIATCLFRGRSKRTYSAQPDARAADVPVVVLVDERTASAAEMLAGALKFHGRAVVVGSRTRGKGAMQTMLPLGDGLGQVNLTTAELVVGKNVRIARTADSLTWGVDPHPGLEVNVSPAQREAMEELWLRAAVLPPRGGSEELIDEVEASAEMPEATSQPRYKELLLADAALAAAVELLDNPDRMEQLLAAARRVASQPATQESDDE